ncbi:MAG: branched-chain amino acid ABC transporter permease [Janthinobacterium lividum]
MTRATPLHDPATPATRARRVSPNRLLVGIVLAVIAVLGIWLPSVVKNPFYIGLLIDTALLGIAALAIGFLAHQCGLMMFGVAGFTGGSTYLFAIAVTQFDCGMASAALFALLGSTVFSALVGALIVRTRPLPFAMLTLALAQMLRSVATITAYRSITGGDDGLPMTLSGTFFGLNQTQLSQPQTFWPLAWLTLCAVMLLAWCVGHSRMGKVLRATRINDERMRFSGFNTYLPRLLAFTLTGFIAAIAGLLTALHTAFASPESLDFITGGNALVSTLVGGAGTVFGPVLGALLYTIGQDQFGATGHLELLTGVGVVAVIVAFREGVMGFILSGAKRLRQRPAVAEPPVAEPEASEHVVR